tara:strand:- start:206 stop:370 length:165 start_codon:yes stop_codon:yes gene_type:complete
LETIRLVRIIIIKEYFFVPRRISTKTFDGNEDEDDDEKSVVVYFVSVVRGFRGE